MWTASDTGVSFWTAVSDTSRTPYMYTWDITDLMILHRVPTAFLLPPTWADNRVFDVSWWLAGYSSEWHDEYAMISVIGVVICVGHNDHLMTRIYFIEDSIKKTGNHTTTRENLRVTYKKDSHIKIYLISITRYCKNTLSLFGLGSSMADNARIGLIASNRV